METKTKFGIFAGLLTAILLTAFLVPTFIPDEQPTTIIQGIKYHNTATLIVKTDGVERYHVTSPHNILTSGGLAWITEQFVNKTSYDHQARYIALGNGTAAQTAAETDLAKKLTMCNLSIANATNEYANIGSGNWSIKQIWEVTGTCTGLRTAGLFLNATNFTVLNGHPESMNFLVAQTTFTPTTSVASGDEVTLIYNFTFAG